MIFYLAVGNSFHTPLTRKSPEEMVGKVMTNVFNAAKQTPQLSARSTSVKFGRIRRCLCSVYGFSYPPSRPAPPWAKVTGMIPDAFESKKKYSQSVRIKVTGGQDDESGWTTTKFRMQLLSKHWQPLSVAPNFFSKVVDDQTEAEDFIVVVTLFSIDKRLFGYTVRLEAGWTLQRRIQERLLGESRSSPSLTDPICSSQPKAPQRTT